MKTFLIFVASLLPIGLLATPIADNTAGAAPVLRKRQSTSVHYSKEFSVRANQRCTIVGNADEVHCRSGPGTSYSSKVTLPKGSRYLFSCVKTGECVTINGAKNCGWDWLPDATCYVNGHYTDGSCTAEKLGKC